MNQTHIHLLVTHLPIFGSILGGLVLSHGLWTKSNHTKIAAYNVLIIAAIGAAIAYFTGEAAEETIENIAGIAETMIEEHEETAELAFISLMVLGGTSLIGLFLSLKKSALANKVAMVVLLISLVSFGLVARTGYLGGQIRHTEVSPDSPNNALQQGEGEQNDD
ncbi:MAG: hypothetical protein ACKVQB_05740 [Bacteroidia bacterium]